MISAARRMIDLRGGRISDADHDLFAGGRNRAANLGVLTPSGDPSGTLSAYAQCPIIVPWPFDEDAAGEEFPEGIVGLSYRQPLPDVEYDGEAFGAGLIAIPRDGGSGYQMQNQHCCRFRASDRSFAPIRTRNQGHYNITGERRHWRYGFPMYDVQDLFSVNPAISADSDLDLSCNFPYIYDGTNLWRHHWGPMNFGTSVAGFAFSGSTGAGTGTDILIDSQWIGKHVGWRQVKIVFDFVTGHVGNLKLKITRNTSWEVGADGVPGDVDVRVSGTGAITGGGTPLETGDLKPPTGTLGAFYLEILADESTDGPGSFSGTVYLSPRVDIPICATVSSRWMDGTQYVVPGGYLTDALEPSPFSPWILSPGGFSEPSMEDHGDGRFVYVHMPGFTPGSSYKLVSDDPVAQLQLFAGEYGDPNLATGGSPVTESSVVVVPASGVLSGIIDFVGGMTGVKVQGA